MHPSSRLLGGVLTGLFLVAAALAQQADGPAPLSGDRATRARPDAAQRVVESEAVGVDSAASERADPDARDEADGAPIGPAEAERRGLAYLDPDAYQPAAALPWLQQAADAGLPVAQMSLAHMYANGDGVPQDPRRAFELYLAAAKQGIAHAQIRVGLTYLRGRPPVDRDPIAGRRWLTAAARQHEGTALGLLSEVYRGGDGVEADSELADQLLMRAAEVGQPLAQRDVAMGLLYGPQEKRDRAQGIYLLEKAAEADEPIAVFALGREYLRGTNVAQSYSLAANWLARAADRNPMAALWLSEMYAHGLGFPPDVERARTMRRAALERASPRDKNEFAWDLSVRPDPAPRNGPLAVEIIEALLEDPANRVWLVLDTLAAAYAEAGRFDEAVEVELDAIAAMPAGIEEAVVERMEERVELYRNGEAYRE